MATIKITETWYMSVPDSDVKDIMRVAGHDLEIITSLLESYLDEEWSDYDPGVPVTEIELVGEDEKDADL